jgi:hypothetical protein
MPETETIDLESLEIERRGDTTEEEEIAIPDRPADNPSISRCIRAWNRAYHKEIDDEQTEYDAEKAGKRNYLRGMPPLTGYANIRDFIACVTYASILDIISRYEAEHFLASAKVALGAIRRDAKMLDSASL